MIIWESDTLPLLGLFEQRFEETFKRLAERGKTPAVRVQYHHTVDVINTFTRTERLADQKKEVLRMIYIKAH